MKKQILFVHSAGAQGIHEGSSDLVAYLKGAFGQEYNLIYAKMPNPEEPKYDLWKAQLEKEFSALDEEVILVGHSLGGSVLLKFLSEELIHISISGLFLIAAPFWGEDEDWNAEQYTLAESFADTIPLITQIYLYYSLHDNVVPSSHLEYYKQRLPKASAYLLDSEDHRFKHGLPKLVEDIKKL